MLTKKKILNKNKLTNNQVYAQHEYDVDLKIQHHLQQSSRSSCDSLKLSKARQLK